MITAQRHNSAMHFCGTCPAGWYGGVVAHCITCHLTFATDAAFYEHRVRGRCRTRAEMHRRGMTTTCNGYGTELWEAAR
jgi:hypothetical protein